MVFLTLERDLELARELDLLPPAVMDEDLSPRRPGDEGPGEFDREDEREATR